MDIKEGYFLPLPPKLFMKKLDWNWQNENNEIGR